MNGLRRNDDEERDDAGIQISKSQNLKKITVMHNRSQTNRTSYIQHRTSAYCLL
jgi:hypothetical protein